MQITAVWIWEARNWLGGDWAMSLNDVCCYVPAWFGAIATFFLGLLTYECTWDVDAAIASMGIMAIVPAHIMRSVGGGFDNECVAVTALCATFYFWCRSLREGSWFWGVLTGLSYFYMVAAWGGYIFVLNMIGALFQGQGQLEQALPYQEQALAIHREVGNQRSEGIVLGHIGELHLAAGRSAPAEAFLEQAIVICDERFRAAAGAFRGSLALIHAERGAFGSARQLLQKSRTLLRRDESIDYGKLMCKVAMVEHQAGDADAARAALSDAQDILERLDHHPDTELGRAIAEMRALLEGPA